MENNSILIVEDEKKTVELLKLQLQSEGFTITAAYDGEEGLQKAKKEKPSLIILDIMLPKIDGLEVCRILKNDSKTKNIPVVILTCRHDMEVRLEGFKKGADDYIVKPFDHRELLARINSILRLIKLQNTLKASIEEVERISVINEINKAISSSLNLEEVLKIIGCQTKRLIDYDLISVALLNKGNKFVKVRTLVPHANIEVGEEFYIPFESSFLTQNITGGTTLSFSDKKILELSVTPDLDKVLSAIIVPLNVRRKTIGSLNIGSYKENAFSTTELEVANQIASQVAIAMENARLYERVSESEKNYHQLFDNALDLILLHDPETGSVIGGNRKVIEALGFSEDELIKMSMSDLISSSSSLKAEEILRKIRDEEELIFETSYKKKDGLALPVEVSAKLIDFHGKQLVQGFARDITVRKQAEKELHFLANITTNAPLAIIGTDNDGIITSWNKGAEIIFGYETEEITGRACEILIPDELKIQRNLIIQEALLKGLLEEIETERIAKSGERVPVKITYSVIRDEKGKNIGIAHIIRNILQERELQRQLIQSEKLSTMGQLVSGVAHELNNPLTGIIGFTELLMLEVNKPLYNDLKRIHQEASRARRIVQNLLSFARMHKSEKTRVDINGIINNVLELKSYEMRVDNIEVISDLDLNLPVTLGDPHQLQQVFLNIINNAHQSMTSACQSGSMIIRTYSKETSLIMEFIDTGPGIPKENITKIFDPFFTTKEVGKGTGLGLSLSYGIIKDHGGYIYVKSEESKGACFTIELPLIIDNGCINEIRSYSSEYPVIRELDILIIDDEDTVLQLFKEILSREENRVELAKDGKIALEKIDSKGYFHVIICDIKMPNMNGNELYNLLKSQQSELIENFIFMSGAINDFETLSFFDREINPLLLKPFSISEVLNAIFKIVNKKKDCNSFQDLEKIKIF